jgi:hypothetical protein
MTREKHDWTEADNIVALYLYRYGTDGLRLTEGEVLTRLASTQGVTRITEGSMERKTRNYRFLHTGQPTSGSNASETSKRIHRQYQDTPKETLLSVVREILRLDT